MKIIITIFISIILHVLINAQTKEWFLSFGGINSENIDAIASDNLGNVYLLGSFIGELSISSNSNTFSISSSGMRDIFLIKCNPNKEIIWAKSIGGKKEDRPKDIKIKDNYIIITGFFSDTADFDMSNNSFNLVSKGNYDIFLAKYDLDGNILWAFSIGGAGPDIGRNILIKNNNEILLAGDFNATVDFDPSDEVYNLSTYYIPGIIDFFVACYNENGQFLWVKQFKGTNYNYARSLSTDMDNNIYLTGTFFSKVDFDPGPNTYYLTAIGISCDVYVVKLTEFGEFVWAKSIGSDKNDFVNSIGIYDNSLYLFGHFQSTIDLDPNTNQYLVTSTGKHDIFLLKLDLDGNFIWAKTFGSTGSDLGSAMAIDSEGNIYVTGGFSNTIDLDPPNTINITSGGGYNTYFCKYSPNGNLIFYDKFYGNNGNSGSALILNNDDIYLTGNYTNTISFDIEPFLSVSNGSNDVFLAKYHICKTKYYQYSDTIQYYETYNFNGNYLNEAGTYYDTLKTSKNCDSIVQLNLVVLYTPLPIELLSFKVICSETGAIIEWTTASETNNDYFIVEKSLDLNEWKVVSKVSGALYSNQIKNYSIIDSNIHKNMWNYYRLKQVDINGNYVYYDVYSVFCNFPNTELNIIGVNSNDNSINLLLKTDGFDIVTIFLYDYTGRCLLSKNIIPTNGVNIISLSPGKITENLYLIKAIQNNNIKTKKVFIYK